MASDRKRCPECGSRAYRGRPGLYVEQCIEHAGTCSQYPSPGQSYDLQLADQRRRGDLAASVAAELTSLGWPAEARLGTVELSADTANAVLERLRGGTR